MTPNMTVLVAASRSDHPHHPVAIRWLDDALDACALGQGLALLPMVAAGFLRVVTHPRLFMEPTPLAAAQEFLAAVLAVDGVALLPTRQLLLEG
jgi:predicted nucleic acid-binding protein